MKFYWFLIGGLSVWRMTHLLAAEDGPWKIIAIVRLRLEKGTLGTLLECFHCLSLWVAAPVAYVIADGPSEIVLTWLGLSGMAILAERLGNEASEM